MNQTDLNIHHLQALLDNRGLLNISTASVLELTVKDLEELQQRRAVEEKCDRCGKPLTVLQHLDFCTFEGGRKVCITCVETGTVRE